eukprot:TRINITY_DN20743_c0_g2_i1.p1 TRINITY_DN20743_c0_g2~~TRINITY_DN20743_c0_g2_i1.p1  ORF type:complete len:272 (+),score=64.35 TRINITY_DN20743_c0_g2_i1:98-817(+)
MSGINHSASSGTLRATGDQVLGSTARSNCSTEHTPLPKVPTYLSVNGLTTRRKLAASTGNLHAYMAEDYHQLNWPLPKMYGKEKYGYSLIDVEVKGRAASRDHRFVQEIGVMSKKLIRLNYDQQILDNEWRKTYRALLDKEHAQATCGENATQKTKDMFKNEVAEIKKQMLILQEQRDMYADSIREIYERCDAIKEIIKNEAELDELRMYMEGMTKDKMGTDSAFWSKKFNIRSAQKKD